jgi:hypothetical protein
MPDIDEDIRAEGMLSAGPAPRPATARKSARPPNFVLNFAICVAWLSRAVNDQAAVDVQAETDRRTAS